MFKLTDVRIVEWPVRINEPQDGGKIKVRELTAKFEHISQEEFDSIYSNGGNDHALLKRVVKDWREAQVQDASDQPMPFNEENFARVTQVSYARLAFVGAYLEIQHGREAARKN